MYQDDTANFRLSATTSSDIPVGKYVEPAVKSDKEKVSSVVT